MTWSGMPKQATQPPTKVSAMDSVLVLSSGKASSHGEEWSTTVRRWLKPSLELGRGPTRSRWMWEKRLAGMGICRTAARSWRVTLARWQNWQSWDQRVMSVDMSVHTHLADMKHLVALMPGWASVSTVAKAAYRKGSGSSRRGPPVEKSQMSRHP